MEAFGITPTNLLLWAFFGFLIGSLVTMIDRKHVVGGSLFTEIFGSFGAVTAGYLGTFFLGSSVSHFSMSVLLLSAIGAFLLAKFYDLSFSDQKHIKTHQSIDDFE